jgi:biopolymer transport protein ExbD
MAEIEGGGDGGKHKGKKPKGKKLSTRVDFTPMVDLGFLLITFFMLTTSMNKPQTMEINMPDKEKTEDPTVIPESQTLTLILGEKNRIFYYFGLGKEDLKVEVANFSSGQNGIRKLLIEESKKRNRNLDSIAIYKKQAEAGRIRIEEFKKHAARIKAHKDGLIVLIKAEEKSKYKNLVDILDEMLICNIGRYAIVDISDVEKQMISNL